MLLTLDEIKKVLKTFEHLERKGKPKPSDIDKMEGCFAELFPINKSSVDIIKENRNEIFES